VSSYFRFPNPVNEKTARLVAGGVVLISLLGLITGWNWLIPVLAVGFLLRVAGGPRYSPMAVFANKVLSPRLGEPTMVAGPPKRFAQTVGALVTTIGTLLVFGFGLEGAAPFVFGIMAAFATLESVFAICVGCKMFAGLMAIGVIPESVCEECANISLRQA